MDDLPHLKTAKRVNSMIDKASKEMKCQNCGKRADIKKDKFCSNCGKRILIPVEEIKKVEADQVGDKFIDAYNSIYNSDEGLIPDTIKGAIGLYISLYYFDNIPSLHLMAKSNVRSGYAMRIAEEKLTGKILPDKTTPEFILERFEKASPELEEKIIAFVPSLDKLKKDDDEYLTYLTLYLFASEEGDKLNLVENEKAAVIHFAIIQDNKDILLKECEKELATIYKAKPEESAFSDSHTSTMFGYYLRISEVLTEKLISRKKYSDKKCYLHPTTEAKSACFTCMRDICMECANSFRIMIRGDMRCQKCFLKAYSSKTWNLLREECMFVDGKARYICHMCDLPLCENCVEIRLIEDSDKVWVRCQNCRNKYAKGMEKIFRPKVDIKYSGESLSPRMEKVLSDVREGYRKTIYES